MTTLVQTSPSPYAVPPRWQRPIGLSEGTLQGLGTEESTTLVSSDCAACAQTAETASRIGNEVKQTTTFLWTGFWIGLVVLLFSDVYLQLRIESEAYSEAERRQGRRG